MKVETLTDSLRDRILVKLISGKITLAGTETDLKAIATNEPCRNAIAPAMVMRLVRAKTITILEGIDL